MGPAGITYFSFNVPKYGKILMYHTHLPVSPIQQHVRFHWFAEKSMPRLLVSFCLFFLFFAKLRDLIFFVVVLCFSFFFFEIENYQTKRKVERFQLFVCVYSHKKNKQMYETGIVCCGIMDSTMVK